MKIQLKNESKATPYFQVKTEAQKRPAGGLLAPASKKAKKAAPAQSSEGAAGGFGPLQMMQTMMDSTPGNEQMQMMSMMMTMMPMMSMMGQMAQMAGGGGGPAAAAPKGGMDDSQWKKNFHELLAKNNVSDKPVYTTEEIGEGAERCYRGTVAVQEHTFEAAVNTKGKKEAQQLAAKAAMEELFPDDFKKLSQFNQGLPTAKAIKQAQQQPKPKPELTGKQLLGHMMNCYLWKNHQRNIKKDDCKYETQEVDSDTQARKKAYVSTVTLSEGLSGRSFQGEPCEGKTEAEASAADECVRQLASVFAPIAEERAVAKKEKNKASLAKLKEEHGKKKAAKAEESTS